MPRGSRRGLALAHEAVSTDEISRALRAVDDAMQYDEELMTSGRKLYDVDSFSVI